MALELKGGLDRNALENAFRHIIERHESLRTRFIETEDGVRQYVGNAAQFKVELINLSGLGEQTRLKRVRELIELEAVLKKIVGAGICLEKD